MKYLALMNFSISIPNNDGSQTVRKIKNLIENNDGTYREVVELFKEYNLDENDLTIDFEGEAYSEDFKPSFEKFMRSFIGDFCLLFPETKMEGTFSEFLSGCDEYMMAYSFKSNNRSNNATYKNICEELNSELHGEEDDEEYDYDEED